MRKRDSDFDILNIPTDKCLGANGAEWAGTRDSSLKISWPKSSVEIFSDQTISR